MINKKLRFAIHIAFPMIKLRSVEILIILPVLGEKKHYSGSG